MSFSFGWSIDACVCYLWHYCPPLPITVSQVTRTRTPSVVLSIDILKHPPVLHWCLIIMQTMCINSHKYMSHLQTCLTLHFKCHVMKFQNFLHTTQLTMNFSAAIFLSSDIIVGVALSNIYSMKIQNIRLGMRQIVSIVRNKLVWKGKKCRHFEFSNVSNVDANLQHKMWYHLNPSIFFLSFSFPLSFYVVIFPSYIPAPIFHQSLQWSHQMILDEWKLFCFELYDEMFLPISARIPRTKKHTHRKLLGTMNNCGVIRCQCL